MTKTKLSKGFSLIELLVTVSMLGIILGMAIPSFRSMISDNQMSTQSNDFLSDINFARSEAVKRGESVSLCKSSDSTTCSTSASIGWEAGWVIKNSSGNILKIHPALKGDAVTLKGETAVKNKIDISPRGFMAASSGKVILCDSTHQNAQSKAIVLSTTGRVKVMSGADASITNCSPS
ncbi:MAG: GspH/FimT family pseudopilin [Methylococcaceae bacterium]